MTERNPNLSVEMNSRFSIDCGDSPDGTTDRLNWGCLFRGRNFG